MLEIYTLRFSDAERRFAELRLVEADRLSSVSYFNAEWLEEFHIGPKVIFDIGSADGATTQYLHEEFPQAKIYAFEPEPSSKYRDVRLVRVAISDHDGLIPWYSSINGAGSQFEHTEKYNNRYPHIVQTERPTHVHAMRLDTFCAKEGLSEIDLIHMDVEGAEYEALVGLGSLRPKLIFLEVVSGKDYWHGARSSREVHRLISGMGYVLAADCRTDRLYVHHTVIQ